MPLTPSQTRTWHVCKSGLIDFMYSVTPENLLMWDFELGIALDGMKDTWKPRHFS